MTQVVITETIGNIGLIRINRPEALIGVRQVWRRTRRYAGSIETGLCPVANAAKQAGNSGPNAIKQRRRSESDAEHEQNAE